MILGLSSVDREWLEKAVAGLRDRGFKPCSLDPLREALPDRGPELDAAWGEDWLVRLVERDIPQLCNVVVWSLQSPGDVRGLARLQFLRSMPVRFLLWKAQESVMEAVRGTGLPFLEIGPEPLAEPLAIRRLPMGRARPDWDEYFMRIARVVATRSDCLRRQIAAIIVQDRRIIATGYNGTPRGAKNCGEGGCERCASDAPSGTGLDECLCLHGEENALLQAAFHGISVRGASLYTTTSPCLLCTKKIINSGIVEVIYDARYSLDERSLRLLKECGVKIRRYQRGDGDQSDAGEDGDAGQPDA